MSLEVDAKPHARSARVPADSGAEKALSAGLVLPRRSKYPILEVSGSRSHSEYGFLNQQPQILGTCLRAAPLITTCPEGPSNETTTLEDAIAICRMALPRSG